MAAYLFTELYRGGSSPNPVATDKLLTDFRGATPFQYRILLPLLAHWIAPLLHVSPSQFFTGTTFIASLLLLYFFRAFLERYMPSTGAILSAPLILIACWFDYTQTSYRFFYPYDVPAVTFFTGGIILAMERRWEWYYPVFAVSATNRETALFLTVAFALVLYGQMPVRTLAVHIAAQTGSIVALKVLLWRTFAENPGAGAFGIQLFVNMRWLWFTCCSGHVTAESVYLILCAFGGLWIAVPFYWSRKPRELRRLTFVIPLFLLGMFIVANLNEKRIYSELTPIICAHAAVALYYAGGDVDRRRAQ
jgi:hypothetical protein